MPEKNDNIFEKQPVAFSVERADNDRREQPEKRDGAAERRQQEKAEPLAVDPGLTTTVTHTSDLSSDTADEASAVEDIMSAGLKEMYAALPPYLQSEFKAKGEATAAKITVLLRQARIKTAEILNLIKEWLKIIPGVNKFFLEQEAKLKTDQIIALHNKNKNF